MLNEEKVMVNILAHGKYQEETNMWYLDNEGNIDMTGGRAKFKELYKKLIGNMKFGNKSIAPIQGKRSILVPCKNGDQCLVTKVYYITNLKTYIICLGQMREEDRRVKLVDLFLKMFNRNIVLERTKSCLYKILIKDY